MAELLDREFQRKLLADLSALYPRRASLQRSWTSEDQNRLLVNLSYLAEFGLIEFSRTELMSGEISMHSALITATGLDFLANDGGLSAILGVVTVKLHDDTLRQLLAAKIEAAAGDPTVKAKLIEKLRELPADALGSVTMKALDSSLSHVPDLVAWLAGLLNP